MRRNMNKTGELAKMIGGRLRQARIAAGYANRADAARKLGINYNTLTAHEDGRRRIDKTQAALYSRHFGVAIEHLLALDLFQLEKAVKASESTGAIEFKGDYQYETRTVPVRGVAAGGLWLEAEAQDMLMEDDRVSIPANPQYDARWQYARVVRGNSVSRQVRDGEYAIFVDLDHYGQRLRGGELVDCQRTRAGAYEHSIKVYAGDRLLTDSVEMETQQSIPLGAREDDTTVEILGVAIGVYRPLYGSHKNT
jgi:phage repressor protein C with HTH and peptisase S24 domain